MKPIIPKKIVIYIRVLKNDPNSREKYLYLIKSKLRNDLNFKKSEPVHEPFIDYKEENNLNLRNEVFEKLIPYLDKNGNDVDYLIVYDLNHLSSNRHGIAYFYDSVLKPQGIKLYSIIDGEFFSTPIEENYLEKNREAYHLWYEYLKMNKPYEEFCKWIEMEKMFSLKKEWQKLPSIPKEVAECKYHDFLPEVHLWWGNVHNTEWENEFNNLIEKKFYWEDCENMYTPICTQRTYPPSSIVMSSFPRLSKTVDAEELKKLWKYLKIYESRDKKNLGWPETQDIVDPGFKEENITEDAWKKRRQRTIKIIKNTGRNIFPGKYA